MGERIHPETGRRTGYAACQAKDGTAHVADADELADIAAVATYCWLHIGIGPSRATFQRSGWMKHGASRGRGQLSASRWKNRSRKFLATQVQDRRSP